MNVFVPYTKTYAGLSDLCCAEWGVHGIDCTGVYYEDYGSIRKNQLAKAIAVFDQYAPFTEPSLIIDCDCLPGRGILAGALALEIARLENILREEADVLVEYRHGRPTDQLVHSGLVGWSSRPIAYHAYGLYCEMLKHVMDDDNYANDQPVLYELLNWLCRFGFKWHRLPTGYNCKDTNHPSALIMQWHVSAPQNLRKLLEAY